jgi:cyclopropane-fatty-acyl-phospholipid synthase
MLINKTADKLVFAFLSKIKNGFLEITTHDGKILKFGDPDQSLKANIKIKNKNFNYNLIRGGSVGFAESYMRGEFETDNLSDLIELTARNIQVIYKFSGLLDLPAINFIKNKIIKNTKNRSKEILQNIMILEMISFHCG